MIKQLLGRYFTDVEMGGAHGTHGTEAKFAAGFRWKTLRKDTRRL